MKSSVYIQDPFNTIESSFVKTMVMTIGEVEYTRFFVDEPLAHPDLARCVFVSFCLILPIVIMNLMVRYSLFNNKQK